jgi:dTDP-4-dehydrorhamnose 3,5-epimerase
MHYQASPHEEAKLVRCVRGALFDVALDLRPASATLSQWFGTELSAENGKMLYVPEGCAHGFQTLTDDAEMIYCVSMPFNASAGRGARFDDAAFAIAWPLPVTVTSANDQLWPLMANHAEAQSARTAKQ